MNDRIVFVDNDEINLDLEKIGKALGEFSLRVIVPGGVTVGSKSTKRAAIRTGRANTQLSPIQKTCARTSSPSQAKFTTASIVQLPAKPSNKGRAIGGTQSTKALRAPSTSRRKPGAETSRTLSPKASLSPRSSSRKASLIVEDKIELSESDAKRLFAPVRPAGRAIAKVSTICTMRVQAPQPGDQPPSVTQPALVSGPIEIGGECHSGCDIQSCRALAAAIDAIREHWRVRQNWVKSRTSLTNQAKNYCRRLAYVELGRDAEKKAVIKEAAKIYSAALGKGTHPQAETAFKAMAPQLRARDAISPDLEAIKKTIDMYAMEILAQLPQVMAYVESVPGFGIQSFAGIVGEAGDLGSYSNTAKLWKRMGLAVIGGERQRKKEGAAGIEHGYNPARRSLMWTIGDCIIKAGGSLKELYNERKVYEAPRVKTKMHAHNRAKRYIEKRLLRDLWRAWRDAMRRLSTIDIMRPSDS